MIDTGSVDESSYDVEKTKAFNLPSMSQLVLGAQGDGHSDDDDENEASLNFEDLMGMEPPAGVDFHASYDQVPKAKVKITKKLKVKKSLNNSCPSFGFSGDSEALGKKEKRRGKKNQRAQSATAERMAPSRSVSFTSTPPQHLHLQVPKPISPRRTKSMQNSFPIGGSLEDDLRNTSQSMFSSDGAFKPLQNSSSTFSVHITAMATVPIIAAQNTGPGLRSFTVMPSESGEFLATPLGLQGETPIRRARRKSKLSSEPNDSAMLFIRTPPPRSKSLNVSQVVGSHYLTCHGSGLNRSPSSSDSNGHNITDSPSTPLRMPPPRSKSLDELAMALFKSPVTYDVSKRVSQRRKPTVGTAPPAAPITNTPEHQKRKKIVPVRQIPFSPRRGSKRSSFLVRSKSAKLVKSSGSTVNMKSDASASVATPAPPRRVKSLHGALKKRSPSADRPRLRLNLPGPGPGSRVLLDDNVSVSASEAVPLAVFASSKNSVTNPSHLHKAYKETLHLVGRWKRKSKKEDTRSTRPLRSTDLESLESKDEAPPTPQTNKSTVVDEHSHSGDEKRQLRRRKSKRGAPPGAPTHDSKSKEPKSRKEEETKGMAKRKSKARPSEDLAKDSLVETLEEKEARLAKYMTKTPQAERKKVDRYWIEAFKRNYARRNDVVAEPCARGVDM